MGKQVSWSRARRTWPVAQTHTPRAQRARQRAKSMPVASSMPSKQQAGRHFLNTKLGLTSAWGGTLRSELGRRGGGNGRGRGLATQMQCTEPTWRDEDAQTPSQPTEKTKRRDKGAPIQKIRFGRQRHQIQEGVGFERYTKLGTRRKNTWPQGQ